MENLKIKFTGNVEGTELKPDTVDIQYLINKLQEVQDFLTGSIKSTERPKIVTLIEEGSLVCNSQLNGFSETNEFIVDINTLASQDPDISFLEPKRRDTIYKWQIEAAKCNLQVNIIDKDYDLDFQITPETNYIEPKKVYCKTNLYVIGEIKDMGGKEKINIHIDTRNHGYLKIKTSKKQINQYKEYLYQKIGAHIVVDQDLNSGEIKNNTAKLIKIDPPRNRKISLAIDKLINSSEGIWTDVKDPTKWVRGLRDEEYPVDSN